MLRLLTLTLLASGALANNNTTTEDSSNATTTDTTTTTAGNGTSNQQQSTDTTTTTVQSSSNNGVTTTQPSSGNSTKLAADTAETPSHAVEADTDIKVDVACTTCEDGCGAATMVWCKAGYNALKHYIDEAAAAQSTALVAGKCNKAGQLLEGDYCAQSARCGISGDMAAKIKCHIHNPNFGDVFACNVEAGSSSCNDEQTNLDTEQKVTARRLVARRNLSSIKAEYKAKATMRVKKSDTMTQSNLNAAVKTKLDAITPESMATKVKDAATTYANTLTDAMLPQGTTQSAADLKTNTGSANVTATVPVARTPAGSTAGATSAAISAAAVAAALLF